MTKHKALLAFLLISIMLSGAFSCKKSPEEPDVPATQARIEMAVESETQLIFYHDEDLEIYYANFNIIISELNGVSATCTYVKNIFYVDNQEVASVTFNGGDIPPFGSILVNCTPEVPDIYPFTTMEIYARGGDVNGNPWELSLAYTYSSGETLTLIRK